MIVTVQLADLGPVGTARAVMRKPKPRDTPGLRSAEVALFAPLALLRPPPVSRAGFIAFWDDDVAFDQFVDGHPLGRRFDGGFEARLRPLRAYGSWPGLPADVASSRSVQHDGPVVVLTLGRLRPSQTVRFLRASRPAERAAVEHDGMMWGSAAVRPPFVATVSIWRDAQATAAYAYGRQAPAHSEAISEQQRKDFHRQSAFIRFAPTELHGALGGTNPLVASDIPI
ncbi:MAG: spheroidene monooxygenase [Actinomycetota bacterium]|nr:spheroidene monooxygenase [Actinomycetota bacterium]